MSEPLSYRNRRGDQVEVASVTATEAKNEFGVVLRKAQQHGAIAITKHDAPEAVVLSMDEFLALTQMHAPERKLNLLREEFDAQFAAMQTPEAAAAAKRAFAASPRQLGEAAVALARRNKQHKSG
jgi:antitoxin Phd